MRPICIPVIYIRDLPRGSTDSAEFSRRMSQQFEQKEFIPSVNRLDTLGTRGFIMVIELSGVQFIMVIELSGVQFGLKSYE